MKKIDLTNIQEAGEFTKLPAGPYICVISWAEDVPEKEYLKITYDIFEGQYAGYYSKTRKDHPDWSWSGVYVKSYKEKALPMFKRFCSAVSKSNGNFVFDGGSVNADERTLVGKKIGLVFQEEEYYSNSGDIRTRLIVKTEFPIDKLDSQKVPPVKQLEKKATITDDFVSVSTVAEEVPWS